MSGTTMRLIALLVFIISSSASLAIAAESPERIFREAREYTVQIRTQITHPFIEDTKGSSTGAGFVIDAARGWIATNAHVVGQSPSEVQVAFADDEFRPARKLYVDPFADVAILEVDARGRELVAPRLDCDRPTSVGETIVAFGHPLGILFTGSRGIVSGHTRQLLNDLVQIDAAIDPGNSGGPVIALKDGRIVGIATAGISQSKSGQLNLATPIHEACRIAEILRAGGDPSPPVMSISLVVDEHERHTMTVARTHDRDRWPLEPGDKFLAVGAERSAVTTYSQLITALRGRRGSIPVLVRRNGKETAISVKPNWREHTVARRGLLLDGALIAPLAMDYERDLTAPPELIVHSVDPSSTAAALGIEEQDELLSVDGLPFHDIDALSTHLGARKSGARVRLMLRRASLQTRRWHDYHARVLPGEDVSIVGGADARTAGAE
jgi:S1-C subfamily serine protease